MYAVIETGGKQYLVQKGSIISVEKLTGDKGANIEFNDVRIVGGGEELKVGTPTVDGAIVTAKVLKQGKDKKILVYKKKRRHGYERLRGHRQELTELEIMNIQV